MNDPIDEVKAEITVSVAAARALQVEDAESLRRANEFFLACKALRKKIDAAFDPIIKAAHDAWKMANTKKKEVEQPLVDAEAVVKKEMNLYLQAEEEIRRKKEAELRERARKEEEERRLALAVEAERAGQGGLADKLLEAPAMPVSIPALPDEKKNLVGATYVSRWEYEVVDFDALLKAAASGQIPKIAVAPNEKVIGSMVRSLKGAFDWPGIAVREVKEVRATGR